jgi:hypothetical protein
MRKLNAILLVLALALLVYFVHKVGLGPIVAGFVQVGWGFLLLLGIFVVAFVLETWNWSRCLRAPPPFKRFLIPSWCGQSINQLTPGSSLGEVVKGGLLANVTSTEAVVSSLILYNMAYAYGTAVVILAGSVGLWLLGFAPLALRAGGSALALAILIGLLLFHRGLLRGTVSRLLRRLAARRGGPRLHRAADHMTRWETEIRLGAEERPWRFPQVVAVNLVTQAFPIIELWVTWLLLGVRLDLARCFIFAGIDTMVNVLFLVVPGKLGIAEGTTYLTSELLRLNPTTGLTKQLVGRSVRLVFSIAGALVLACITVRRPRVAKQPGCE